jgi:hypothetical protein
MGAESEGSPMVQVQEMIHRCGRDLTAWSRVHFGSVTQKIREKKAELKRAEEQSIQGRGHDQVLSIRQELNSLLLQRRKDVATTISCFVVERWGSKYKILS